MRFFNGLYPLLYVGFAKEFIEKCESADGSCMANLLQLIRVGLGVVFLFFSFHLTVEVLGPVVW